MDQVKPREKLGMPTAETEVFKNKVQAQGTYIKQKTLTKTI